MPRSLQVARGQPLVAVQSETTDPGEAVRQDAHSRRSCGRLRPHEVAHLDGQATSLELGKPIQHIRISGCASEASG